MTERGDIEQAIRALEQQRDILGDTVFNVCVAALRHQLAGGHDDLDAVLKGERKYVTVMFADISGFTTMSEKLDPEDVRSMINACFARLGTVIDRYDGHIDKFIGDEIMALFGAPVTHENDPERALRAALDMMMALEQFNMEYADQLPQPLALHFGLNSGLVITGGIGTGQRQDYSVMGDTVNLAARLEDLSETGEILVGAETHRRTAPLFDFEALPPVQVKGKSQPMQVYRLLRAKAVHGGQIRGIEGLASPLVGRDDELTQLNRVLEKFYQNQGGVVAVSGEAGLGKSRLIYELCHLSEQQPQGRRAHWAEGHALSHGENAGYLMARDMLRHVLGLSLGASPSEVAQRLHDEIDRLLPEVTEDYAYLAYLLDLPLDEDDKERIKYLQGDALQQHISQAVQNFIRAKTHQAPLIMVWEDLHWADPSSLNLLEDLLPLTQDCPLLVFLVYRPTHKTRAKEFQQRFFTDGYLTLQLARLNPAETKSLLANLLGDCPLPDRLHNLILEKTEGNPFYLEEVVRSLLESEVIAYSEEQPDCLVIRPGLEDIKIPDTLQGVIMARIDRLAPPTKRLLQVASVIGRDFPYRVLARVMGDGLEDDLNQLEALDLIVVTQRTPHLEYSFQHIFTRESIYNSLLHSDCRQLHQQVGEAIEDIYAGEQTGGDLPLVLAYHFEESGDKVRALAYLSVAAHNASATFANQEARALYRRALVMFAESDVDPQRWDLLAGQERILNRLGERQQQATTLTIMQTLSALLKDDERLATTHNRRSRYFDRISEYQAAVEAAEAGLRAARRSGNRHLEAESLNLLALAAWRRFDYPEVQRWATQALRALMVVGDPTVRITSLFHLGRASYRLGQYNAALEYIEAAQELAQDMGNRDEEATSYLILGWIYQRLGDYDRAKEQFQTNLELRQFIGHRYGEATALSHLGWLAVDQHQPEAGLEYCQQALDISRAIGDRENEAYALSGLALNYEQLGQLDKAAANYEAALTIQREIGAATLAIFGQVGLARIALSQQDLAQAREQITPVVAWIEVGNAQKFWDPWSIYLSTYQVLAALGEVDTAQSILEEAHTILHQRANEISNKELRDCFLDRVKVNRELEQAWLAAA